MGDAGHTVHAPALPNRMSVFQNDIVAGTFPGTQTATDAVSGYGEGPVMHHDGPECGNHCRADLAFGHGGTGAKRLTGSNGGSNALDGGNRFGRRRPSLRFGKYII